MRWLLSVIFLVSLLSLSVPAFAAEDKDAAYRKMVEQSLNMPADFDFAKARDIYTETSFYDPMAAMAETMGFPKFFEQGGGDAAAIKGRIEKYLADNFAMFAAQSAAMDYYKKAGDEKSAAYHEWAFKGLVTAFLDSGNGGGSAQGAYHAVNKIEEYVYLRMAGVTVTGHKTVFVDHKPYDVLVSHNQKGESGEIWFDNSAFYGKFPGAPGTSPSNRDSIDKVP